MSRRHAFSTFILVLLDRYTYVLLLNLRFVSCWNSSFVIIDPWYVFFLQINDQCSTQWVNHRDSTQKSLSAGDNLTRNLEENSSAWLDVKGSSRSKKYMPQNTKDKVEKQPMEPEKFDQKCCTHFFLGTWISYISCRIIRIYPKVAEGYQPWTVKCESISIPPLWAKENASWTWDFSAWFNGGRQPTYPNLPLQN